MGKPTVKTTPDKSLRFPNPKFIAFMNRFWNSLPVTQAEKDTWNNGGGGADPHAPLILVDKITLLTVNSRTKYELVNITLPDIGDDLEIEIETSSSGNLITFANSGPYNIIGHVRDKVNSTHFDLNISFSNSYIHCNLKHNNCTDTSLHVLTNSIEPDGNGKFYLFQGINMNGANQFLHIALDVNADTDTIKFIVEYESASTVTDRTISNRIEIRSY